MLFSTLAQPQILLLLLSLGFLLGFIFEARNLIFLLSEKNKVLGNILYGVCGCFLIFCFFKTNLAINYGELRLYAFCVFFLGIIAQRLIFGKLFAYLGVVCYNKITNVKNAIKEKKKKNNERKKQTKQN